MCIRYGIYFIQHIQSSHWFMSMYISYITQSDYIAPLHLLLVFTVQGNMTAGHGLIWMLGINPSQCLPQGNGAGFIFMARQAILYCSCLCRASTPLTATSPLFYCGCQSWVHYSCKPIHNLTIVFNKKYAHNSSCVYVLSGLILFFFSTHFKVVLLALWQWNDCPSTSTVTSVVHKRWRPAILPITAMWPAGYFW